ncbi:hypothetical protein LIS82_14785 [Cytobacillus solani]|uniref:hypothetical protein n=1 Tax=Cytobacillus solani TaxID=1637975 RepID=UPI002079A040|nr:hypothetical protein [Cytobacillus solani]USK52897.1 hypothetical protein LIS82_14785 [Cytobacillus solani]
MEAFIFILIIGFIFLFVFLKLNRKKRKLRLKNESVPSHLGMHVSEGKLIVKALDASFPSIFKSNVKTRILEQHPNWTENEYQWRFFELKRYFVMNSLLKSVPMFSEEVDEVWHEMLMFTKDYEKFSMKFYGEFLHHMPNMESEPILGERAFFDWMYLSLFEPRLNSHLLWGVFLKHPIKKEILLDFKHLSDEELLKKYFRQTTQWDNVKKYLINKLKLEIQQAEQFQHEKNPFIKIKSENEFHIILPAAVFFSLYGADHYENNINSLIPFYSAKAAASGSSCSGFGCVSSSDSDSGGGSSCSSCGGGCSS